MWLVTSMLTLTLSRATSVHQGPERVVDHNQVNLPLRESVSLSQEARTGIEKAALEATHGGTVQSVRESVWVGKPVWMCTVSRAGQVWHVMVDQTDLRAISKIAVPH